MELSKIAFVLIHFSCMVLSLDVKKMELQSYTKKAYVSKLVRNLGMKSDAYPLCIYIYIYDLLQNKF